MWPSAMRWPPHSRTSPGSVACSPDRVLTFKPVAVYFKPPRCYIGIDPWFCWRVYRTVVQQPNSRAFYLKPLPVISFCWRTRRLWNNPPEYMVTVVCWRGGLGPSPGPFSRGSKHKPNTNTFYAVYNTNTTCRPSG
jgi:hypothetical protein